MSTSVIEPETELPAARTAIPDRQRGRAVRVLGALRFPLAIVGVAAVLAWLPHRAEIPPRISADYAYTLIGADRLHDGLGYTSLQPVAPYQDWEYGFDYGWLTQWPVGYAAAVVGVRFLLGCNTIQACQWIAVMGCAAALVGWFAWLRRCAPPGFTGTLLAAVGATSALATGLLLSPSTDVLLIAGLPFLLLGTVALLENDSGGRRVQAHAGAMVVGLLAGGLVWVRYAAVFVPAAIGLYLALGWLWRRRVRASLVVVYAAAAALPVFALALLNRQKAAEASMQEQLNLGQRLVVDFSVDQLGTFWRRFTDLGYYDYRPESRWMLALWPAAVLLFAFLLPAGRRAARRCLREDSLRLSLLVVLTLFAFLIVTTSLFGDKFDYIGLDRYYLPIRPLYFALFLAPLLYALGIEAGSTTHGRPRRVLRIGVRCGLIVGLLLAGNWTLRYAWPRPYARWLAAPRERTDYGDWAWCLTPGADELEDWLCSLHTPQTIVISNFHDLLALWTGICALPLPPDKEVLQRWIDEVTARRGIERPQVLFVLDPDNGYRNYYLPEAHEVIWRFGLEEHPASPAGAAPGVYRYLPQAQVAGR